MHSDERVPEPPLPVDRTVEAETSPAAPPLPNTVASRFEVLEFVGSGSFAEVWRIRDCQTGKPFALKRLRSDWRNDPSARRLLAAEAQAGSRVRGPYVVRVVASETSGDDPHTMQEWLDGTSLEARLQEEPMLPIGSAVWIARQCAMGLADLERAGFSHGDVKPSNVFATSDGQIKLIDLGFARPVADLEPAESAAEIMGTPEYLAPETLIRSRANPVLRDMYSLGVTLYRMLAGRLPFVAETTADLLRMQRQTRPASLRRRRPDAPRALDALVRCLLAKQPIRRPQSHAELIRRLVAIELSTLTERLGAA